MTADNDSLGITQAAAYVGTNVSYMRRLADEQIIPSWRTLGKKRPGHRRFWLADLNVARMLMSHNKSPEEIKEHFAQRAKEATK